MYKVTNELNINGFSVNPLNKLIARNNNNLAFNTLEYYCIFIATVDTAFTVENTTYQIKRGSLTFIGPEKNVVCKENCTNDGSVFIMAFTASFFEKSAHDSLLLNSNLFYDPQSKIVSTMGSIPIDEIIKLIIDRLALYKTKNNNGLYISVAHNCIEAILLDGLFYVDESACIENDTRKFTYLDTVNRFRVLLQKNYQSEKQVSFYADLLNITPRRLSEMTESVLGKSAKQVIIDKMVAESVRMLKHTNYTVSEIAYQLGFNDEANFSTFIKKHTLKKPRLIREELNNRVQHIS